MTTRLCPWNNWIEWEQCKQLLWNHQRRNVGTIEDAAIAPYFHEQQVQDVRQALAIIQMWRSRTRVPHSLESSAAIMQVRLNDCLYHQVNVATSGNMLYSLRLEYSMAIVRLVNGLVEPLQQKMHAQSVAVLAEQLDLPRELVDVRHEATHASIPSLSMLRLASSLALDWLKTTYWDQQLVMVQQIQHWSALTAIVDEYDRVTENEGSSVSVALKRLSGFANQTEGASLALLELMFPPGDRALGNPHPFEHFNSSRLTSLFKHHHSKWMPLITCAEKRFGSFQNDLLRYLTSELMSLHSHNMSDDMFFEWQQQLCAKWIVTLIRHWKPSSCSLLKSLISSISSLATDAGYQVIYALVEQLKSAVSETKLKKSVDLINSIRVIDDTTVADADMDELIRLKDDYVASTCTTGNVDIDSVDWSDYPLGVLPSQSESVISGKIQCLSNSSSFDAEEEHSSHSIDHVMRVPEIHKHSQSSLLSHQWTAPTGLSEWVHTVSSDLQSL